MSDKRSVATDALETLGTIIDEHAGRDAIHLAVEPVVAGITLRPGEDVGFAEDGTMVPEGLCGGLSKTAGIVDPFLRKFVRKGQRFWLVVYPRQITSLRHVWTHPAFPDESQTPINTPKTLNKEDSETWLRNFIDNSVYLDYNTVIAAASGDSVERQDGYGSGPSYENDGEYLFFLGRDAHGEIPPEFWDHVEVVTGKKIPSDKRPSYFACSC